MLEAQLELERRGVAAFMQQLEKTEPELANFMLEILNLIYTRLSYLGGAGQSAIRDLPAAYPAGRKGDGEAVDRIRPIFFFSG